MPTLRDRVTDLFPISKERRELRDLTEAVREVYLKRPFLIDDDGRETLQEAYRSVGPRSSMADWIMMGASFDAMPEAERLEFVRIARHLYAHQGNARGVIRTWTNFGFGQTIDVSVSDMRIEARDADDPMTDFWHEFWYARRNGSILSPQRIYRLSDTLLVDGEVFFVWFTDKTDGRSTLRIIPTEQITDIVTAPGDPDVALYYRREYTDPKTNKAQAVYYRDWRIGPDDDGGDIVKDTGNVLPEDAVRADAEEDGIDVCMMQVAYEWIDDRGQSLLMPNVPWLMADEDFAQDLAAVATANAAYARKVKTTGGSRARKALQSLLQSDLVAGRDSNPPPAAGAWWIENEGATVEEMPLNRAGALAADTANVIAARTAFGVGLFPHWMGHGQAFRLATATAMEQPILRNFRRYQQWWRATWNDVVHCTLDQAQRHAKLDFPIEERDVDATMDALLDTDVSQMATALNALGPWIPVPVARRIALEVLNVPDIDDVLDQHQRGQDQAAATATEAVDYQDWVDTVRTVMEVLDGVEGEGSDDLTERARASSALLQKLTGG